MRGFPLREAGALGWAAGARRGWADSTAAGNAAGADGEGGAVVDFHVARPGVGAGVADEEVVNGLFEGGVRRVAVVLRGPVLVLQAPEQVLGVRERRHPAVALETGVPADVVPVQVRAHHEVDRLGRTAAGAQTVEERRVELVPAGIVPLLVVAETGVDQNGVTAGLHDPCMDRPDQAVGTCLDMGRYHPVLLRIEGLLVEPGKHAVWTKARRAQLLDFLDGGSADPANGHGVASSPRT